jgi:hypothetical protein
MKGGGSYKCTVNQNVGGMDTKGTTYMKDGMVRGEYKTNVQGVSMESTLIVRDGYTYSWSSAMPNLGFKAKVVGDTAPDTNAGTSGTYSFNAEQIGDYDCQPWTSDDTMFAIPATITFTEVKAQ